MIAPIVAVIIFAVTLAVLLTDRLNRVVAAAAGAAAMVVAGHVLGFYTDEQAIEAIDFETIGLLLGMILIVRMLEETGFFEYMAIVTARRSRGRPWLLLALLGTITTLLSLVLPNVTTVVLIAPVTVLIAEVLGLNPIPLLIAEALLSDTGGTATLIGDPPNVLIGTANGLSFDDFLTHVGPIVLAAWLAALFMLLWLFRHELRQPPTNPGVLERLSAQEALKDRAHLRRLLIVLGATVGFFFIQGALGVSPATVALTGAAAGLLWVAPDMTELLKGVEWGVLIFFSGLFVIVGGLAASGVLNGQIIVEHVHGVSPVVIGLLVMWGVALLSAIVDNIPITIAMIPIIAQLSVSTDSGSALWWALALGAGLGGNGTIIGSTANVVVVSISERTRTPITPQLWTRRGMPVMLGTLIVASVLYALLFGWLRGP